MTVTSMFLGTSTVLVRDGDSAVLVDGYFTRPALLKDGDLDLSAGIAPDPARIEAALQRAGIDRLDLVVVSHSHVDHALDSPVVAERTGARLGGSASTRMIARGLDFPEERFDLLEPGAPLAAGALRVTPITAVHSNGDRIPGEITAPIVPPASVLDYRTGGCFDFLIESAGGRVLVHPTANWIDGALDGIQADLLYLGAGAAGIESTGWREEYWAQTVLATGARVVQPVHWDAFWEPIDRPLTPLPPPIDDFPATVADFRRFAERDGVRFELPELWRPVRIDART